MATTSSHNKKSSAVKRILSEARESSEDSSDLYTAAPLEDNIFEWHFTLRGPSNTEFANGLYHGRILLPAEYPMRPPNLMLLTPNGRWELNKKICLTFTGFHEEMWQPAWGIRTALLGLQTFMTAKAEAAVGIGALDYPVEARQKLAAESRKWKCDVCEKATLEMLPDPDPTQQPEERKEETLPEGLQVDLNAQSHKPQSQVPLQSSALSDAVPPGLDLSAAPLESFASHSAPSHQDAASAITATAASSAIPTLASAAADSAAAPSPITSSQPRSAHVAPSVPPRNFSSSAAAASSSSSAAPAQSGVSNRVSATEQKLTLIDNCIKALSILVALLVVKRLL
ncbi:Ubiquitin-conjugating enzyme, E2 [Kalmanozyma brasiliensis GHG001]|uniref:Ubiquitin-conjugating enzyme, E2 n=1 Tax=Kalmanozyma brasiliensis (strain GHG001) TaxID=1365824 RepID=UPI001CE99FE5|nr:Ubiquitin-conjugating enzyme, E2 [Kalmanozyma brasiliensis GHG001]EST04874.2 Ubiquitin-conjugating enzyme, E2 [Kalmanozyma brasiliensis GHG001]